MGRETVKDNVGKIVKFKLLLTYYYGIPSYYTCVAPLGSSLGSIDIGTDPNIQYKSVNAKFQNVGNFYHN